MADGVDAAVNRHERSTPEAAVEHMERHARLCELPARHDAVLAAGELGEQPVDAGPRRRALAAGPRPRGRAAAVRPSPRRPWAVFTAISLVNTAHGPMVPPAVLPRCNK